MSVQSKIRRQLNKDYDIRVSKFAKILSNYTCPETCKAECCKYSPLEIDKIEYPKFIKNIDSESRLMVQSMIKNCSHYFLLPVVPMSNQCVLLKQNKCSVYGYRPEVCRKFPFETIYHKETDTYIQLRICALSVLIIKDFIEHVKSHYSDMDEFLEVYIDTYEEGKLINEVSVNVLTVDDSTLDVMLEMVE